MKARIILYFLILLHIITDAQLNDRWVNVGSISDYEYIEGHTATLLANGNVLVCGGLLQRNNTTFNPSNECFLYDPQSNVWSEIAPMTIARAFHTSTLLNSGKILIVGGSYVGTSINSCEIYDPDTNSWMLTDSLNNARTDHGTILLPDGNVLVAGGYYSDYVTLYQSVSECELFNSQSHFWENGGVLIEHLDKPSLNLVNDSLVAAVQYVYEDGLSAQVYNINTKRWSLLPKSGIKSMFTRAKLMEDSLLVVIGNNGKCEIFNFEKQSWITADSTDFDRNISFRISKLNERYILVTGGGTSRTDIFDVKTLSWLRGADMPEVRSISTATVLKDGSVLVVGGNISGSMAIRYIPDSTLVGIKTNSKILPAEFFLYQNYPNPFNPSTTITYTIPASETLHATSQQLVQLKVYDVLGREVATLVNKKQSPGNYSVTFNAKNLPSGLYFYRLTAGSFSQTKKMLLLK